MKKKGILTKLGQRIRQWRKVKNMSQEQLAERADLHPTFIGKIERAEINPTIVSLEKIAQAFKIPLSELVILSDDEKIIDTNVKMIMDSLDKALKELKSVRELIPGLKPKKHNK